MSSLKAFEEATLWRPSLRPVRTTEEQKTNDVPASTAEEPNKCGSADAQQTQSPSCIPCAPSIMSPQYRTENFMMYGFKVALCSRPGRHRWDDCPFAHPTENARRRDPRVFSYSCHECPSYRNAGYCPRGDQCEYSHGVFEARLHPDSYRTVACKDGEKCTRKICFFYHNEEEKRVPTGLQDVRAQITAELGDTAFDMNGDTLRAVANSLLTSSPSLANTMNSLCSAFSQPVCQTQTVRSAMSMGNSLGNTSPLAATQSGANTPAASMGISSPLSGLSLGQSGVLMTSETVAPCLKGANRNRAKVRELAHEVGLNPDSLMNSLRVSALQGELTPYSLASVAVHGTFNSLVEDMLEELSVEEDLPLDKLRGWLVRQTTITAPCPRNRAGTPTHRTTPSPTCTAFSPCADSGSPQAGQRVNFGSFRRNASGISRASPSPSAAAGIANQGPVLPGGNDEVIRAFGTQQSGNTIWKTGTDTWRKSSGKPKCESLTKRKSGAHEGAKWRGGAAEKGSADDARW